MELPLKVARDNAARGHLLSVAEGLFAEQGYGDTPMQAIAKQAEMSLASLYKHFSSKGLLYRAILVERDRQLLASVTDVLATSQARGLDKILELYVGQLEFMLAQPDYLKLQLQEGRAWYHAEARPSAEEQAIWEQGVALIGQLFRWGAKEGFLVPGEPEDQTRMLLAVQQARLAGWVANGMQASKQSVVSAGQADFIRSFVQPKHAAKLLVTDGSQLR